MSNLIFPFAIDEKEFLSGNDGEILSQEYTQINNFQTRGGVNTLRTIQIYGHYVYPWNDTLDFGAGDLTIQAWVYIEDDTNVGEGAYKSAMICGTLDEPYSTFIGWNFGILGSTTTTGTGLFFDTFESSSKYTQYSCPITISKQGWHHLAVTVKDGVRRCFLDGVLIAGTYNDVGGGYRQANSFSNRLSVGQNDKEYYWQCLDGCISSLILTKGVAFWTEDFTPPQNIYPNFEIGVFAPDSFWNTASEFELELVDSDLVLGTVSDGYGDPVFPIGTILSQSVPVGAWVSADETIGITVAIKRFS